MRGGLSFAEFVELRQRGLLRTAWLLTGDWHAAEDLVQVTLVKVWPHWSRVSRSGADAYVRKALVTTYASSMRRRWHLEQPADVVPDVVRTADDFAGVELRDALRQVLSVLTPAQRAVLVLRYYEDLTEIQTAAVLGVSIGTVKSQMHKTLARLREAMGENARVEGWR